MSIPLNHHDMRYFASNEDASSTAAAILANVNYDDNGIIIDNIEGEHNEFMDALKKTVEWDMLHHNVNASVQSNAMTVALAKISLHHHDMVHILDGVFLHTNHPMFRYMICLCQMHMDNKSLDDMAYEVCMVYDYMKHELTRDFFTDCLQTEIIPEDVDTMMSIMKHIEMIPSPQDAVDAYISSHDIHRTETISKGICSAFIDIMEREPEHGNDNVIRMCISLLYLWKAAKSNNLLNIDASRTADDNNVLDIIRQSFNDMKHVSVEFGFEELRGCYEKA